MGFIIARAENGREAFARIRSDFFQKAFIAKSKKFLAAYGNFLAIIERETANIDGITERMLGQAFAACDLTAGIGRHLPNGLYTRSKAQARRWL